LNTFCSACLIDKVDSLVGLDIGSPGRDNPKLDLKLDRPMYTYDMAITYDDIAAVISRQTGIPVGKMKSEDLSKLADAESELGKRVVGQKLAVESVSNALRRNRIGLRKRKAPVGSFLFLGPTGVGKTELAKALADYVLDDESKIIRVDMTEYMERHEAAKLIGSPPGYVGYGEGGQLTERIKRQPYSVVLFDEVEKAHPDVFNLLLQVLDDGRLTDAEGRTVSFEHSIVIFTSNIGSEFLTNKGSGIIGMTSSEMDARERVEARVHEELRKHFRPEFLNRLDDVIIFDKLSKAECRTILDMGLRDLRLRLGDMGLTLDIDEGAMELLLEKGFDTVYGARPLRRALEKELENKVANEVIKLGRKINYQSLRSGSVRVRRNLGTSSLDVGVWFEPAFVEPRRSLRGAESLPA